MFVTVATSDQLSVDISVKTITYYNPGSLVNVGYSLRCEGEEATYQPFIGSLEVSIKAIEMLEPTAEKELEQLEQNLSGYAWLPFINLRLAVKL